MCRETLLIDPSSPDCNRVFDNCQRKAQSLRIAIAMQELDDEITENRDIALA